MKDPLYLWAASNVKYTKEQTTHLLYLLKFVPLKVFIEYSKILWLKNFELNNSNTSNILNKVYFCCYWPELSQHHTMINTSTIKKFLLHFILKHSIGKDNHCDGILPFKTNFKVANTPKKLAKPLRSIQFSFKSGRAVWTQQAY